MIYLHIPFCKQKCSYCNFHFSTSLQQVDAMVEAMKKEIFLRREELQSKKLNSLYFGGGTPSILKMEHLQSLIDEVAKYFEFSADIEVTLEANPDDLQTSFLQELAQTPINRLSIGTQSFFNEDLQLMNRAHNALQAQDSIKRAQDFGFGNISIDLIYGSPSSSIARWKENLNTAVALEVPHISSYALTVEPRTAMENWIATGKMPAPQEADQNEAFYYMSEFLKENGFLHYEISNFARKGFQSRHNTAYWKYEPYLGIGPSAHSYNGHEMRSWNIPNNTRYLQALDQNKRPFEAENLNQKEQLNEMLMIGLRTTWGVSIPTLKARFSAEFLKKLQLAIDIKLKAGLLIIENNHLKIPEEHWFFADGIASDLFAV